MIFGCGTVQGVSLVIVGLSLTVNIPSLVIPPPKRSDELLVKVLVFTVAVALGSL